MANSPPKPPYSQWDPDKLLEELGLLLRFIGCGRYFVPAQYDGMPGLDESDELKIDSIKAIAAELKARFLDPNPHLQKLSEETQWHMPQFFADCLNYPNVDPYVRALNGVRIAFRCQLCFERERPADAELFWICNPCMARVIDALRNRKPVDATLIFRTYTPTCRCEHADDDTVLVTLDYIHDELIVGRCETCLQDELDRRRQAR